MKSLVLFYCLIILSTSTRGQTLIIDSIIYEGNIKTKTYILRRELDFKIKDTISVPSITVRLNENRSRILNTGLFKEAKLNIISWDTENNRVIILIHVEENWYIYPAPIFELADRNFNVWWNEFDASFARVNYGIRFNHNNLTGQNDALKLTAQTGYSTKYDVKYSWPYWGKSKNWRFTSQMLYSKNKETFYKTEENQLVFFRSNTDYPLKRFNINTSLENRTTLQLVQTVQVGYTYNKTVPEISEVLNPDFFLNKKSTQSYFSLKYDVAYDDRDLKYYPSKGRFTDFQITKEGLGNISDGLNSLYLNLEVDQYFPWSARHNAGFLIKSKASIIRNQIPYYNSNALGYGEDNLKGFEYYVVDGMDYFYFKFRERYIFYENNFKIRPGKKLSVNSMPVKLGISAHTGAAYVNNQYYAENNNLANRWIYSGGLSLECLAFNTALIRIDWSINDLKQSGFYLHFRDQF